MARVVWSTSAVRHLREITNYVAQSSVARADALGGQLLEATERLEFLPLMGRVVPEFRLQTLPEVIVRPYRILYLVREDTCSIIGVFHSKQDLTRLVRPEDLEND